MPQLEVQDLGTRNRTGPDHGSVAILHIHSLNGCQTVKKDEEKEKAVVVVLVCSATVWKLSCGEELRGKKARGA